VRVFYLEGYNVCNSIRIVRESWIRVRPNDCALEVFAIVKLNNVLSCVSVLTLIRIIIILIILITTYRSFNRHLIESDIWGVCSLTFALDILADYFDVVVYVVLHSE